MPFDPNKPVYWNTGNYYTEHGQRFTAQIEKDGIRFQDFDRGINGKVLHAAVHTLQSESDVRDFVIWNYDRYNYVPDRDYENRLSLNPDDETHGGKAGSPSHRNW